MTTRTSLILVGHSGAGKSTLAMLLSRSTGRKVIEIGHYVTQQAALHSGLSPLEYADEKLRSGKYFHFVERLAAVIESELPAIIVGPRQAQEITFLREVLQYSIVIGLEASLEIRQHRRPKFFDSYKDTSSWLKHRDTVERAWGAENVLRDSDVVLDASKSPQLLFSRTADAWKSLGKPTFNRAISYHFPLIWTPLIRQRFAHELLQTS